MYSPILALHSLLRWLVLTSLIYSIFRAWQGWYSKKPFTSKDNAIRHWTATITHLQLAIGIWLYSVSPIINYFLHHYRNAVGHREIRFFGMEHSTMMVLAIVVISFGSATAKRKQNSQEKFKTMAIWFTIGLLIILANIPWPFSPLTSRPYLRAF
ncbi:hypothetical protein SD10_11475 [Spirosoma radiotolerans]|uniref:Cytochrome B561 n=1 Tax=Spirosoma radiotolerans TaxID=1379870 RepID=A0A0E3V6Z2_9BACT|nr:hypothetical protein SD10_11475 [Spirosoma radiotolerans]